jgi:hypothetical protein
VLRFDWFLSRKKLVERIEELFKEKKFLETQNVNMKISLVNVACRLMSVECKTDGERWVRDSICKAMRSGKGKEAQGA